MFKKDIHRRRQGNLDSEYPILITLLPIMKNEAFDL